MIFDEMDRLIDACGGLGQPCPDTAEFILGGADGDRLLAACRDADGRLTFETGVKYPGVTKYRGVKVTIEPLGWGVMLRNTDQSERTT